MSWDENAAATAKERWGIPGKPNADMEPLDWLHEGQGIGFRLGARWMRDQLRTDEAVERVARGICRRNWPNDSDYKHYWQRYRADFRADARAAITALLGEDA